MQGHISRWRLGPNRFVPVAIVDRPTMRAAELADRAHRKESVHPDAVSRVGSDVSVMMSKRVHAHHLGRSALAAVPVVHFR